MRFRNDSICSNGFSSSFFFFPHLSVVSCDLYKEQLIFYCYLKLPYCSSVRDWVLSFLHFHMMCCFYLSFIEEVGCLNLFTMFPNVFSLQLGEYAVPATSA